jgi:hypothetical protein
MRYTERNTLHGVLPHFQQDAGCHGEPAPPTRHPLVTGSAGISGVLGISPVNPDRRVAGRNATTLFEAGAGTCSVEGERYGRKDHLSSMTEACRSSVPNFQLSPCRNTFGNFEI